MRYILLLLTALVSLPAAAQYNTSPPTGGTISGGAEDPPMGNGAPTYGPQPSSGDWGRVGPTFSIGSPFIKAASLDFFFGKKVSAGMSYGGGGADIGDVSIKVSNWDLRTRWHPFGGSFFFGVAYGHQKFSAKTLQTFQGEMVGDQGRSLPMELQLDVDIEYLTPHLGWFAVWNSGFTLGFEVGYQKALSSDSDFNTGYVFLNESEEEQVTTSEKYKKEKKDMEDTAEAFGEKGIPYINLIRLGWLF
ncbi:MAG: hypothetical protein AB7T49_09150 [Oligoflexales bacterium]